MTSAAPVRPILLVDDSEADRDILVRAYRRVDPERPIIACSGASSAKEELTQRAGTAAAPGLAIVDINMAEQNGLDLVAELRAEHPVLPVLVLSGSARSNDVEVAFRRGAAGFFVKPMGLDAVASLLASINHYWFESGAAAPYDSGSDVRGLSS